MLSNRMRIHLRWQVSQHLAMPMFAMSIAYLFVIAIALQSFHTVIYDMDRPPADPAYNTAIFVGLLLFWPPFVLESLAIILLHDRSLSCWAYFKAHWFRLLICLVPPLRLAAPHPFRRNRIWLPGPGWQHPDRRLRIAIERALSVPMFFVALLIVPVLAFELMHGYRLGNRQPIFPLPPDAIVLLEFALTMIWMAFAVELILLTSLSHHKFEHLKKHWIDVAIVILPLFAFLRGLQMIKVAQLGHMGRLYRLRALLGKIHRLLLVLQLIDRMWRRSPEQRLERILKRLQHHLAEVRDMRDEIQALRQEIRARDAALDEPSAMLLPAQPEHASVNATATLTAKVADAREREQKPGEVEAR